MREEMSKFWAEMLNLGETPEDVNLRMILEMIYHNQLMTKKT